VWSVVGEGLTRLVFLDRRGEDLHPAIRDGLGSGALGFNRLSAFYAAPPESEITLDIVILGGVSEGTPFTLS